MDIEVQIYELVHGWVYHVGNVYQEFHPDREGFAPMTEAEARELANIIYKRITNG